ncbi:MAG TPA: GIY-YIG nuclease family protein [Burkholderiales bacterium]
MSFWVYMLRCADDSYYIGHTDDLEVRMAHHHSGQIRGYTSSRLPVRLVFSQAHDSRVEALAAERQIKGWSRKKKQAMIRGDWAEVSRLARSGNTGNAVRPSTGSGRTVSSRTIRGRTEKD